MPLIELPDGNWSLEQNATGIFDDIQIATEQGYKVILLRGGTRSSKTHSIMQTYLSRLLFCQQRRMGVGRTTFPALRSSAYKDFIELLKAERIVYLDPTGSEPPDLYSCCQHNKSEHTVRFGTNEIAFVSVDDPRKFRGPQWNDFWFNEAGDFAFEDFNQINLRLSRKATDNLLNQCFLDINPDDPDHWIKSELEDKQQCYLNVSNYKHNRFLDADTVQKIEYLRENDPAFWNVFGLGNWGERRKGLIYPEWQAVAQGFSLPGAELVYGLDFGYNVQTALVAVYRKERKLYLREMLYETHLTNQDLVERLKTLRLEPTAPIYCDSAEPDRIEELYRAGFNAHSSDKQVKQGIDFCKRFSFHVSPSESPNLVAELKLYKWREDKHENLLDEPVKFKDHLCDALRMACMTHGSRYWADTPYDTILPQVGSRQARKSLTEGYG
jgi:phage terminase large subunit